MPGNRASQMRANGRKRRQTAVRILADIQGLLRYDLAPAISLLNLDEPFDRLGSGSEFLHTTDFGPRHGNRAPDQRMKYKSKERHREQRTNACASGAEQESEK